MSKEKKFTPQDVSALGRLAALEVSPDAAETLGKNVADILGYVELLKKVPVDGVPPLSHVHNVVNVFREDVVEESLPIEDALRNAPDKTGRSIRVPLIIE